jgi:hypothetical protein
MRVEEAGMDEDKVKEIVASMTFSNGKQKDLTIDELAIIQPGLARIMPEVGARTWKLFYAAKAGNWENAIWQWKETKGLFELAGFVRPKHEDALNEYMEKDWSKLEAPLKARDFAAFEKAFHEAIASANAWHDQKDKPFIKWKLPDFPPPDLDFTPRR